MLKKTELQKIRVLHILQSNQFSGAENVVCQIINMFRSCENYEMAYCSPDGQICEILREKGIKYFPIKKLAVREINAVISQFHPTIIHAHDAAASVISTLAKGSIPLISHIHGNHLNMRKAGLKSILVKYLSAYWSKIIWVSQSAFEDYKYNKFVTEKSLVLPNIILKEDIMRKLEMDEKGYDFDCVVLGRINSIKNPMRAISIFEDVITHLPDLKVAFIGNGDLEEDCRKYVKKLKIDSNIFFLGYMNNPLKALAGSKLLVMTSIYEGTPMSALEAMCLGIPIVSTPTDGIVDLIVQNQTGFYSDKNEELASMILELLTHADEYKKMCSSTRKRFDELMDVSRYKNELANIYSHALEESK